MRILLIAYYYPPLGGPASIRLGKMVKYLRRFGWEIDVISVKDIIYHSLDYDLEQECQSDQIIRTKSWEILSLLFLINKFFCSFKRLIPLHNRQRKELKQSWSLYFSFSDTIRNFIKNLLIPDEKIGWFPFAYNKAKNLLLTKRYDLIMTSIGPFTAALIANKLSNKYKIPLVIDYRDHWTLHPYNRYISSLHRQISRKWEEKIIRQASLITTIGNVMKSELLNSFPIIEEKNIVTVRNGFDEEDFNFGDLSFNDVRIESFFTSSQDDLYFTYTGSFYPPITPKYFLEAMSALKKRGALPNNLKIRFIGNYHQDIYSLLSNEELSSHISIIPSIPHRETIKAMVKSDVLILMLSNKEGKGILTSKVFEYLRSGKPILAMIPENSEIAKIILRDSRHFLCHPEDVEQISQAILKVCKDVSHKRSTFSNDKTIIEFSREKQYEKLSRILSEQIASPI
ncbi:MAG: glycosyltransferase [Candidatus Cloacimonetes bacterium]|nr:glycosyltransferase [Candidatus Cloacimonadota bacterium]